jgi:hypothetical protein
MICNYNEELMSIIGKFSPEIEKEIDEKGYHVLNQSLPANSYPNPFPKNNNLKEIKIGKSYTIRLFIKMQSGLMSRIDSGLIDIRIVNKTENDYTGEILTLLPPNFPLAKGQNINITKDEILYEQG